MRELALPADPALLQQLAEARVWPRGSLTSGQYRGDPPHHTGPRQPSATTAQRGNSCRAAITGSLIDSNAPAQRVGCSLPAGRSGQRHLPLVAKCPANDPRP
jgi:hypothetical protein